MYIYIYIYIYILDIVLLCSVCLSKGKDKELGEKIIIQYNSFFHSYIIIIIMFFFKDSSIYSKIYLKYKENRIDLIGNMRVHVE